MMHPVNRTAGRPLTLIEMARSAMSQPDVCERATIALGLFHSYCAQPMPRIPGCDTGLRIAIRIDRGMDTEKAAAREYAYRWRLFLDGWINHAQSRSASRHIHRAMCHPAPHLLGQ